MSPIVSVILPTYNDLHYIETTIRTVCAQSFTNFELIIVDDGSTDDSPIRLRGLVATDTRLRYVRTTNAGQGAALNIGLGQVQGRYIAFMAGDDLLHPSFLHTLVAEAESSLADVVMCSPLVFNDGQPCEFPEMTDIHVESLEGKQALQALLTGRIIPNIWNRLYRKETLGSLRFTTGMGHEDLEFSARLLMQAKTVSLINQSLYGYRQRPGSTLLSNKTKLVDDRIQMAKLIKANLQQHGQWTEFKPAFQIMAARHVGYYGFKDLIRTPEVNWMLYLKLLDALRNDAEITLGCLRKLPISSSQKKWVGLPLLNQALGRWFLEYQFKRLHRA